MTRACAIVAAVAALALALATPAAADPYRLRASALADTRSPVGLVVLDTQGEVRPWLSAEALVWTGGSDDGAEGDVLVIAVKAAHGDTLEATLGRFIAVAGALRPVHIDGVKARAELPWQLAVEAFGGAPVVPEFGSRGYDWLVGGRVSRALGAWGAVGLAFLHRRDHGVLSDEEVALDASGALGDFDLAGRASYDLVTYGLSELTATGAWRVREDLRLEAFASHVSPSRILPATSLFSVLGDIASRTAGGTVWWRAAPRLDLEATFGGRLVGGDLGAHLVGRGVLRLDDRGAGAIVVEARRESSPDGAWTGARAGARVPIRNGWSAATELELAIPDDSRGRGAVWPWALVAVKWRLLNAWEAAAAVEASASPEYSSRVDALVTLSYLWERGR